MHLHFAERANVLRRTSTRRDRSRHSEALWQRLSVVRLCSSQRLAVDGYAKTGRRRRATSRYGRTCNPSTKADHPCWSLSSPEILTQETYTLEP